MISIQQQQNLDSSGNSSGSKFIRSSSPPEVVVRSWKGGWQTDSCYWIYSLSFILPFFNFRLEKPTKVTFDVNSTCRRYATTCNFILFNVSLLILIYLYIYISATRNLFINKLLEKKNLLHLSFFNFFFLVFGIKIFIFIIDKYK